MAKQIVAEQLDEAGLTMIRRRATETHLDYPHSRAVSDVDLLLQHIAALEAQKLTPQPNPVTDATAGDAVDGWESAGAYSHRAGTIQWENGYAAIKQLAESASGYEKDSRFMHETIDAIWSIAAQELENMNTDAKAQESGAAAGSQ